MEGTIGMPLRTGKKRTAATEIPRRIPFAGVPGKGWTVSIAVPSSLVLHIQTEELKAYVVGQLARTATIFSVDEIVVYNDCSDPFFRYPAKAAGEDASDDDEVQIVVSRGSGEADGAGSGHREGGESALRSLEPSRCAEFLTTNLRYLETPQYLRKKLFEMTRCLKLVGLQNPVDAPHHLRQNEILPFREGVVTGCTGSSAAVYCGLPLLVKVGGSHHPVNSRVTLELDCSRNGRLLKKLRSKRPYKHPGVFLSGRVVDRSFPLRSSGLYWGYKVREARDIVEAIHRSGYEEPYDLIIGTSERGEDLDLALCREIANIPFKHCLLVFGGVSGIEQNFVGPGLQLPGEATNGRELFHKYLNVCPGQTSRTIRTEEAVAIALSVFQLVLQEKLAKN